MPVSPPSLGDASVGDERIVIRPRPGGRPPARAVPNPPAAVASAPEHAPETAESTGLVGAAMPLLQLLARLRTMATQPDPALLRQRADAELASFEQRAAHADAPADQVRRAHYAICASLDDAVLNTPWGGTGAWAERTLAGAHHPALRGDRFFDVLEQAESKGAASLPLVELMHACLSLGYLGDARRSSDGPANAERARAEAFEFILRYAPAVPPELAAEWRGVDAPYAPTRTIVPIWVAASAGLAALAGLYLFVSGRVNDASDQVLAAMMAAPPAQMPLITRDTIVLPPDPPPDAPDLSALDRLRDRLHIQVAAGEVSVAGTPETPIVRMAARTLFPPGSAALLPAAAVLLQQVGAAFRDEPGSVRVIGATDSQPFRSVQFPSNFQLSAARAQAAEVILAAASGHAARWSSEGRAAADPIASNASAEGREQNRRVDVVLNRPSP